MALEDFVDPEVGVAVAVTALAASPQARNLVRRGLVYGLAGLLRAGETVTIATRGVAGAAQQTAASASSAVQEAGTEARAASRGRRTTQTNGSTENP
ncbi:MAG TPA: hypothetical protein VF221_10215 [Chloroflexota bacterium]